jgi:hypothetical protein
MEQILGGEKSFAVKNQKEKNFFFFLSSISGSW